MNISVIIPAKNEEKYINIGLEKLVVAINKLKNKYPNILVEIIVANNESIDATAQIAKKYTDKIINTNAQSIAGVRNAGAAAAKYEILVFIDADSVINENGLLKIYEIIKSTKIAAGCVRILTIEKLNFVLDCILQITNLIFKMLNTGSGMFFCLASDFKEISGFDEKIYAAEDLDFVKRIKKHLKKSNRKFKHLWDIPITTSTRKLRLVNIWYALKKLIKFTLFSKKMMYNKQEWTAIFYDTEKLR